MSKKVSKAISYIVFLLIGIALLWFSFRNIDLSQLMTDIKGARYSWMLASLACLAISLFFRALRWNLQIKALGFKPKAFTTFGAVLIAYLANCIFPRLGEVVRCSVLKRKDGIPFDKSFGSVISERIIDLLVLFILAFLVIALQWKLLGRLITSWFVPLFEKITSNIWQGVILIAILLAMIFTIIVLCKRSKKIMSIWNGFLEGLKSIVTMKDKWRYIIYTIGVWGFYIVMTWLPFYMLDDTCILGFVEAVTLLGLATMGVVAPVPGGIGTYHFITITLLGGFYGITEQSAGSFAAINHGSQMLFYLVTGIIAYCVMFIFNKKNLNNKSYNESSRKNTKQDTE
ncbi:MAG: lysylphosphatidylglycerol synthase transmembrane domain-containing protein [Bacteroidales bacterium]|nr:lysylphosphatidylglycerol synthase transmembrane domain-containing protein [Bacteroidales bacterium]MDY6075064.1 lysylphosphatidylglycerol synthase transmembrane domain-containing protein [Bacteroidales bacterium]